MFACIGGEQDFPARYNIAPTQPILIVRRVQGSDAELVLVRWGLIPSWVKVPRGFTTLINARGETVIDKPAFRGPMRHRRCLIPADGFYEWTGPSGAKQPHLIRLASARPFAFAGIYDSWLGADGSEMESAAILTTAANDDMHGIHDRMPVILGRDDYDRWLDCRPGSADPIRDLCSVAPPEALAITKVGRAVNSSRSEGAHLHQPEQGNLI